MKTKKGGMMVVLVLALVFGMVPLSEAILPHDTQGLGFGFLKGGEFLKMKDHEKNAYAMGVVDGIAYASMLKEAHLAHVRNCGKGFSNIRMLIAFNHSLNRHPLREEVPMARALTEIVQSICDETEK